MINFSELEPFEYYYISSNESYSIEYNKLIESKIPSMSKEDAIKNLSTLYDAKRVNDIISGYEKLRKEYYNDIKDLDDIKSIMSMFGSTDINDFVNKAYPYEILWKYRY